MEKLVGKIRHYYPKIGVAVVDVSDDINVGDEILIKGNKTNFKQTIDSMQIEHKQIERAEKGQAIGMKVNEKVREGDGVYKI